MTLHMDELTAAEQRLVPQLEEVARQVAVIQAVRAADGSPNDPTGNPMTGYSSGGTVKVEFWYCDEGQCGDYNPSDPTDVALLRFDAYIKRDAVTQAEKHRIEPFQWESDGDYVQPDDSSYCTQLLAQADPLVVHEVARNIADFLASEVGGGTWKRACEEMSWADHTWAVPRS